MHSVLRTYITEQMETAASFVLRYMPIHLDSTQIYEGLVRDPKLLDAFSVASQHLPPNNSHKRATVEMDGVLVQFNLRLASCDKYPMYLMPKTPFVITRESELGRALEVPMRVAAQWDALFHVFNRIANAVEAPEDVGILMLLFPWLEPMIEEYVRHHPIDRKAGRRSMKREIDRELKVMLSGKTPDRFPALTPELNEICRSGRALMAQYQMLESSLSSGSLVEPPLTVVRSPSPSLRPWPGMVTALDEILSDWREYTFVRRQVEMDEFFGQVVARADRKGL